MKPAIPLFSHPHPRQGMMTYRWLILLVASYLAMGLQGCYLKYYKVNSTDKVSEATVHRLITDEKYFILHAHHIAYALSGVELKQDTVYGHVDSLLTVHTKYLRPAAQEKNRFPGNEQLFVLMEVHLYTNDSTSMHANIAMPLNHFNRMDVYDLDKGPTTASAVMSTVGIAATTAGVIVVIAAAVSASQESPTPSTTVSCSPRVFVSTEKGKNLTGILFSGAFYNSLERFDYLPLGDLHALQKNLSLQIQCTPGEEQFFNELKLLRIAHIPETKVLIDRHGTAMLYQSPQAPVRALAVDREDSRKVIQNPDGRYYSFTNLAPDQHSSDIILDFKKPVGVSEGRFVVRARNSPWSGYLIRSFKTLYGDYYKTWAGQKDKADPKEIMQWQIGQTLPLLVSVKIGDEWKYIDYFATPGIIALRDMIMNIDFPELRDASQIKVRLQTAYMFWDLDFAGMDFSKNPSPVIDYLPPKNIQRSDGQMQSAELNQKDNSYALLTEQQELNLSYELNPETRNGLQYSYFLGGSGFYHDARDFSGKPQMNELNLFLQKGGFDRYSRKKFDELMVAVNKGNEPRSKN
ncbi:MAG: hypothetical protein ACHQET_06285 [Chitinophagales bacterium]